MSGGLPPCTAVARTVTMLSPAGLYFTVTSGHFCLKPSRTAWIDFCSVATQMPMSEMFPEPQLAPPHHCRLLPFAFGRLLHGALVAHVLRELLDVFRQRRRSVHGEVRHDLRAESLGELHLPAQAAIGRDVFEESRVFEIFRTNAQDDLLALIGAQSRLRRQKLLVDGEPLASRLHGEAAVRLGECRFEHVHRRTTDEAADEEVDRAVVELLRGGDLL